LDLIFNFKIEYLTKEEMKEGGRRREREGEKGKERKGRREREDIHYRLSPLREQSAHMPHVIHHQIREWWIRASPKNPFPS
jgi:hypothetical protein